MAAEKSNKLPWPPPDFNSRSLPIRQIRANLFRIHPSCHRCLNFSKDGSGRFDDPLEKYGVLYTALAPEGAFAEVFLRHLSRMIIAESEFFERSISSLDCNSVGFVDLTGAGLRQLSCDNRISTEMPYSSPQRWSRAIFEHPQKPGGIIFLSRHNPRFKCAALFDRSRKSLRITMTEALMGSARLAWTVAQINRYRLAIDPKP